MARDTARFASLPNGDPPTHSVQSVTSTTVRDNSEVLSRGISRHSTPSQGPVGAVNATRRPEFLSHRTRFSRPFLRAGPAHSTHPPSRIRAVWRHWGSVISSHLVGLRDRGCIGRRHQPQRPTPWQAASEPGVGRFRACQAERGLVLLGDCRHRSKHRQRDYCDSPNLNLYARTPERFDMSTLS